MKIEQILDDIFFNSYEKILIWIPTGKIIYANPGFLSFLNLQNIPSLQSEICSEEAFLEELEYLKDLQKSGEYSKNYRKFFHQEEFLLETEVSTHFIRFKNYTAYLSRVYPYEGDIDKELILRRQNNILLELTRSSVIDSGNLEEAVREITEAATRALDCERSGVWFFTEDNSKIRAMNLYNKLEKSHSSGYELTAKDFPAYFRYLYEERALGANNAYTDPNTYEFSEVYLKPFNIKSMLDAPIRIEGKMIGVICNETVGKYKKWTVEEINFAGSLADFVSRAIEASERRKVEEKIKEINDSLESKVREQTSEIRESLFRITHLKELQDGDYFLTSLILNPMMENNNHSEIIKTDFLIKQFKQFKFRDHHEQIGGDFCYTDTLKFPSKQENYIFFLNADAMGKSMQGASGAIVLGTVILNALWELKTASSTEQIEPKKWLENIILEINNIFLTFGGLMQVSCFIGLIEEAGKKMLYSNCEHPAPILYRDRKVSFFDNRTHYMKLGTLPLEKILVRQSKLLIGDILFIGSDGKDDIELSGRDGSKNINEDETLFWQCIENAEGNLDNIYNNLKTKGRLIDDLSILRIEIF